MLFQALRLFGGFLRYGLTIIAQAVTAGMKLRHHIALIVLVCATLLSSHPALAQFSQQGPKLVGTGAVGIVKQGFSVSVSADGEDFAHDFREIQTGD